MGHMFKCHIHRISNFGAGEGNRTLVFSLEGCCITIMLRPHNAHPIHLLHTSVIKAMRKMVEGTGFEPVYAMRADLQSAAFNHSATPPWMDQTIVKLQQL